MIIKKLIAAFIFTALIMSQGCTVFYKDLGQEYQQSSRSIQAQPLSFRIDSLPVVASDDGIQAIEDTLKRSGLFQEMEKYYDDSIPGKGLYIHAEPLYKAPSIAAMGFGYLSFSTLTILPAWSNHDGYKVRFTIYEDGEKIKTVEYKRERFVAVWIALLPFSWINLFTSEEYDAFESITQEFVYEFPAYIE